MVSTRRQSHGLQDSDAATLALRAKSPPPQTEAKVLRDGTVHGEVVTHTERPNKRRRTRGSNVDADTATENDDRTILQQSPNSALVQPDAAEEKTNETPSAVQVDDNPAPPIENGERPSLSPGKRKRGPMNSAAGFSDKQQQSEPTSEAKHHRFDSAEPETQEETHLDTSQLDMASEDKPGHNNDLEDEDEDEAPEQLHATSSSLIRGLPSSMPHSQPQRKSKKKQRYADEKDEAPLPTIKNNDSENPPDEPLKKPSTSAAAATPTPSTLTATHITTSLNDNHDDHDPTTAIPITTTKNRTPNPNPNAPQRPQPRKDVFDAYTKTLTRHIPSTSSPSALSSSSPALGRRGAGTLPQKASKQSANMREQLLRRHRHGPGHGGGKTKKHSSSSNGMFAGFAGGARAGFFAR